MMLFVYGTLMDDRLVEQLTGRRFATTAAVLAGYRKVTPLGGYPYIVPDAGAAVDGVVLHDLDECSLRQLDAYEDEGRLYARTAVVVTVDSGPQPAMTYVGLKVTTVMGPTRC